ncbi:hypothetical protein [Spiroplasma endosymbiont of Dilophus febrilis]
MLFFQNYSNLYPPNKTLCAPIKTSCCCLNYKKSFKITIIFLKNPQF